MVVEEEAEEILIDSRHRLIERRKGVLGGFVVGIEEEGFVELADGFVAPTELKESDADVVMDDGILRLKGGGLL